MAVEIPAMACNEDARIKYRCAAADAADAADAN
jgi:hypothetical protein